MNDQQQKAKSGEIVKHDFSSTQMERVTETAASAVAAREKASVEARYIMAINRPRDLEDVRVRLLKECSRPGFAEVARYNKPIGNGIEGPSIRFAEAALRCMTNVLPEVTVVFEDDEKRILRVSVTDLEANVTYTSEVSISKTVERKKLKDGQQPISKRTNSMGETTYLVAATEDDLLNKQNAQISKAIRTSGLRLVPGDIIDECMAKVIETQRDRAAKDPDVEKRKIIDAFAALGVSPAELKEYVGHELAALQPAEIVDLRATYLTIKDGEATWQAVMESKAKQKPTLTAPKRKSEMTAPAAEEPPAPEPSTGDHLQTALEAATADETEQVLAKFGLAGQFPASLGELPADKQTLAIAELHKLRLARTAPKPASEEAPPEQSALPNKPDAQSDGIQHVGTIIRDVKTLGTGTNSKGPWTLFGVTDDTGTTYTTFSKSVADDAGKFGAGQVDVDITCKRGKKGFEILAVVAVEQA